MPPTMLAITDEVIQTRRGFIVGLGSLAAGGDTRARWGWVREDQVEHRRGRCLRVENRL
jgi:hypothetical protein